MLPSIIAEEVKRCIEDFLQTTYPVQEPFFDKLFDNFFKANELFRGPYFTLKLPFRPGKSGTGYYPEIPMAFPPYEHQEAAFKRLSADNPQSTIIATGTGSGKTECFMYPLLHYCWQHRTERGIKAIIIYPLNALATDQMKRFAKEIYNNPQYHGNISVGMYIGGLENDSDGSAVMTEDTVITRHETMQQNPPDILLTNYKMLDLLLLRAKDVKIWKQNDSPDTLRYIVVDELHTFDGAQGTDLACLLRRVLARQHKSPDNPNVCFVGTSATLGSSPESRKKLLKFATDMFGVPFDNDSVITENVLNADEFLESYTEQYANLPRESDKEAMNASNYPDMYDYLRAQAQLWFDDSGLLPENKDDATKEHAVALGKALKQHRVFRRLVDILGSINAIDCKALIEKLKTCTVQLSNKTEPFCRALVDSLFALISYARDEKVGQNNVKVYPPFLNVRVQLWLREMRRMVATVSPKPELVFADDIRLEEHKLAALPLVQCRSCGRVGYVSLMKNGENQLSDSLEDIYNQVFHIHGPTIEFIFPLTKKQAEEEAKLETFPKNKKYEGRSILCGHCLTLLHTEDVFNSDSVRTCPHCGRSDALIPVDTYQPRKTDARSGHVHVYNNCPHCGEYDGLTVLGSRAASLISVVIHQLFSSRYNDDAKLLAFSDSVQDASHRAGFFEARTYKFNLRAAIAKLAQSEKASLSLTQFQERFIEYWQTVYGSKEKFLAQFTPSDLSYRDDYKDMIQTGKIPEASKLYEDVCNRLRWEITAEFGYSSLIGRTLEKCGVAIARVNPEKMTRWTVALLNALREHYGNVSVDKAVTQFLLGVVRMLRVDGGIYFPALEKYMHDGDIRKLNYHTPEADFMPDFYKSAPIFATTGRISRFDPIVGQGSSLTKYQKWQKKCLGVEDDKDLLPEVFRLGEKEGVIRVVKYSTGETYALEPDALEIDNDVDMYECSQTHQRISAPHSEAEIWNGMPNLRPDIDGVYIPCRQNESNYYKNLYRSSNLHRVIAREHTGLLTREDREQLEQDFVNPDKLAAPNTLSCTPTLEMGINIGNLSSVILCSVPPKQAAYIQRVGRSGRRDGSAFNFVTAGGKPHDLHFFANPLEMISGEVTPPGMFLNAPAVLERQLTAYCFDRWIESVSATQSQPVPRQIRFILSNTLQQSPDLNKFPFTLTSYIEEHTDELLNGFLSIFNGFTDSTRESLSNYIHNTTDNDGLASRIISRFTSAARQRDKIKSQLISVNNKIKRLKEQNVLSQTEQEELDDLEFEKKALQKRIARIDETSAYNFFTDEGLLPNYTFPEAGVKLQTNLYYKTQKRDGDKTYKSIAEEYERSSRSAIHELAPGSTFYVHGRKLEINQINLADTQIERWHFCGDCSHVEKVGDGDGVHTKTCPKCGSSTWGDKNMTRNVVRLKQVVAYQPENRTHSYDNSEEREPSYYNKYLMPEFDPQYRVSAWKVKENEKGFPFGFEYYRKATFREVNFGHHDIMDSQPITVSGNKVSRNGFRICRECGMVDKNNGEPFRHHISCKHYHNNSEKSVIECLYLYREFTSEAVRILLPMNETDISSGIPSFIAALRMGLEEKFGGDVDHLDITISYFPDHSSGIRKYYLVMYDNIPGGSGYLKELAMSADSFVDMLQKAYDRLKNCKCQNDKNKDGCYECLFAYRSSRDLPDIRRSDAMNVLSKILNNGQFEQTTSIDDISVHTLLESELEKKFIEALKKYGSDSNPITLEKQTFHGHAGYLMKMKSSSGDEAAYYIIPQIKLEEANRVSVPSTVDFLIAPVHQTSNKLKPIAVFTDGFQYHGDISSNNYRFHLDLAQRMAIVRSQRYLCWSLSYNDVQKHLDNAAAPSGQWWTDFRQYNQIASRLVPVSNNAKPILQEDSFENLIRLLRDYCSTDNGSESITDRFYNVAKHLALDFGTGYKQYSPDVIQNMQTALQENPSQSQVAELITQTASSDDGDYLFANTHDYDGIAFQYFAWVEKRTVVAERKFIPKEIVLRVNDCDLLPPEPNDDESSAEESEATIELRESRVKAFKRVWNGVLHAYNLLQFLPQTTVITTEYINTGQTIPELAPSVEDEQWNELFESAIADALPILRKAYNNHWELPELGYEIEDAGVVCGEAEIAWRDKRIAVLLNSDDIEAFEKQNWKVVVLDHDNIDATFQQISTLYTE
ncbi:MAG: DEAD/DEAH box helicase [Thermoguttaceae bacterium]|nr:DEAD/DEAH box helicase [Thermoguttaceae bacterium]